MKQIWQKIQVQIYKLQKFGKNSWNQRSNKTSNFGES